MLLAFYLMIGLAFLDETGYSVFPLSPVEVLDFGGYKYLPAIGLAQNAASDDILENHQTILSSLGKLSLICLHTV